MSDFIHTSRSAVHDYMDRLYSTRRARYRWRRRRPKVPNPGQRAAWNTVFDEIRSHKA